MKDDTVSRAAVMQSLTKEYNRRRTGDGLKLAWIEKAVNEVPAVQPKDPENGSASCINPEKMHDRTTGDCISRQAAIDCVTTGAKPMTIRGRIAELPAVQPQTEEDCDTCKHGYFGDRQCDNCRVRFPSHYEREEEQHA